MVSGVASTAVTINNLMADSAFKRAYETGICRALRTRSYLVAMECRAIKLNNLSETLPLAAPGRQLELIARSRSLQSGAMIEDRRSETLLLDFTISVVDGTSKATLVREMEKVQKAVYVAKLNLALTEAYMESRLASKTVDSFPVVTGIAVETHAQVAANLTNLPTPVAPIISSAYTSGRTTIIITIFSGLVVWSWSWVWAWAV